MPALLQSVLALSALTVAYGKPQTGQGPVVAPKGQKTLTVGILGDFGWTGWEPANLHFCNEVLPVLQAHNLTIPRDVQNDCDPGDRAYITNATALQESTATYIGDVCEKKDCKAFVSVGDNFYDSGVDFTTTGINRFQEAWVDMYSQGVFTNAPWYQCLGNHDIVYGQSGVDFETKIAPLYDDRWYFGTEKLPYYTYDLVGEDWTATFVVVDSDCFIDSYQKDTSVYKNPYTTACHKTTQTQVDFLTKTFAESKADWKFLQLHHGFLSVSGNYTELWPLISVVEKHNGIVLNGHDHCTAHYQSNNTNFVLSGGAGYPQAGDCNNGVSLGPFVKFLGANSQAAANGFVTLDLSAEKLVFEYYLRDMQFDGGDLFPVKNDMKPQYSFKVTEHAK
ncbi:putative tartrate-resistant acid phosphatase type 5 precursor [Talaromyces proteolyticus]|uniref:Tartrate-resistant acid phosphatase type 5 n=1 Tax=Talaromyces proteolyticus TaxID=1131652 RepID=A0AAD4KLU2_9EURO|nr:putative tartrate-resistant acid phosphatase type 5 precursor [Talaromyces proteolyticus]KAH8694144.1 putative tartrate-resistant acid phosphatase type 5 precursor [Talaromyces proteolyticus]